MAYNYTPVNHQYQNDFNNRVRYDDFAEAGYTQYETDNRMGSFGETTSATRCRQRENVEKLENPRGPGVMFGTRNVLQKTLYGAMEVTKMTTNPMPRRGLGKIKFEAIEGEEAEQVARKFSLISNQ